MCINYYTDARPSSPVSIHREEHTDSAANVHDRRHALLKSALRSIYCTDRLERMAQHAAGLFMLGVRGELMESGRHALRIAYLHIDGLA